MSTAAVVIIGTEILTGKFADENGPFLISALRARGVWLTRLAVVPDTLEAIAEEVRLAASRAAHVITTGGVGPTHDDITFAGVALGLGVPLVEHAELLALLDHYGLPRTPSNLRMATVPEGTTLLRNTPADYPVLRAGPVFVLPGIPKLVRRKWPIIAPRLGGAPVHLARLFAMDDEPSIAGPLSAVAEAHPSVLIGSYPRDAEDHRLIVTVEGADEALVAAAADAAAAVLTMVRAVREAPAIEAS